MEEEKDIPASRRNHSSNNTNAHTTSINRNNNNNTNTNTHNNNDNDNEDDINDEGLFEPERLLEKRELNGMVEYLVKWLELSPSQNTWEPAESI